MNVSETRWTLAEWVRSDRAALGPAPHRAVTSLPWRDWVNQLRITYDDAHVPVEVEDGDGCRARVIGRDDG